jgi:hypothetical protein
MWEPVGPLPATVYWRRRWVAIASAVLVVVLFTWGTAALATGGSGAPGDAVTARPANRAAVSAPQQVSPSPAAPPPAAPQPGTAGPPTSPPEPPTATAPGTSERLVPDDSPRASAPVPPPAPVPPTGPVPCTNDMLAVAAEVDPAEHRVGEHPLFRLVVTNTSGEPCVRDLDPARQEIVVWNAAGEREWSSNDCSSASGVDLRTLVPGQPVAFAVRWAGRTSADGCPEARTTVPAGGYTLLSRVDDVISPPTPMTRHP